MKIITNGFKEEIAKLGREIDFKINLHINDKLITQDNQFIVTQDNMKLIVEQFNEEEIDETIGAEDIYNATIVSKGSLLSTLMKEFDFEISEELRIGDVVDCSFGLKVGDEYEYVNYGKFIIYSKEFNEDTKTYSYVAYDSMLFTMKEFENSSSYTGALFDVIPRICEQVGLECDDLEELTSTYPNLQNIIDSEIFDGIEMTYRDVLDIICQALGLSMIVEDKTLKLKSLNNTIVDTFDGNYLKDTNVRFNKKYMINSVVLSRSDDSDNIYRRDEESIDENGVHEFKIKDNLILNSEDRELFIDEIFEQLNGVEFYINDFTSTGITYLDWLDYYNIEIDGKTYKCLMLNDEIKIQQGLEESIYTDEPEETVTDYKVASKTDKEVSFIVDKQKGEISAKVSKGDVINEINLDESGASIKAEKVNLVGYVTATDLAGSGTTTINGSNITTGTISANRISGGTLTGTTISGNTITGGSITGTGISNGNKFSVDSNGNMSCSNANITGGKINLSTASIGTGVFTITGSDNYSSYMHNSTVGFNIGNTLVAWLTSTTTGGQLELRNKDNNGNTLISDQIMGIYKGSSYTTITATGGVNHSSKEEYKKNIKVRKDNIKLIKDTDVYNYLFKEENDNNKPHIGLIIGDKYNTPSEIISENGDSINIYDMCGVMWGAIKEQQEQIEELKEQIKSLRGDEL